MVFVLYVKVDQMLLSLCSEEAVAAFVETSGGSLVELSLNNVKKVTVSLSLIMPNNP